MKSLISSTLMCLVVLVWSASAQDQKSVAYGILIDNTGSMRRQLPREIEAAKEIVKQVSNRGTISIFGFATDPAGTETSKIAVGLQCSGDVDALNKQLEGIYTVGGQTTLLDAINVAAERLSSARPANCKEAAERNLVIITDGEDRASGIKPDDLISRLKLNGTRIFAIALRDLDTEVGLYRISSQDRSKDFLKKVTKETGGSIVFPKKKQTAGEIVKALFETVQVSK